MFRSISDRLSKTLSRVTGRGRITEDNIRDTVRQIRMALLEADVALPVTKAFIERVRKRALGEEITKSLNPGQAFVKIVHDELVVVLGGDTVEIVRQANPTVIMLVGLQGAGKTTTAAKLAKYLAGNRGNEMLLVSTDVYRPAAREQLAKLADNLGMDIAVCELSSPIDIAVAALAQAHRDKYRWLIVDTAGRLHVDADMMAEAKELHAAISPHETLFVLDAMGGQDVVNSVSAFHEALPLTGVIATKADGDARSGGILSVREVTGLPVKLLGTGEKLDALEAFDPQRMASRILGMGDVVGFVETVQRNVDQNAVERVAAKVSRGGRMNLEDFRSQLKQLKNFDGMNSLLDSFPSINAATMQTGLQESQIRRQIGIIDAMTPAERRRPELVSGSRKRRIAQGSGLQVQDVTRLLKQHRQLTKIMKRASKPAGMKQLLGELHGYQGRPPQRGRR
ncbi:MAG: signal recognition particle protein [Candidatus Rariloculaceae bacterium]